MTHEAKIKKILVVLSPDLIRPDEPMQSALIQRAISLARNTGSELELFHVSYDGTLDYCLFASEGELQNERERLTDEDATRLAELATRIKGECVNVRYDARWDCPRTDAILRKIAQSRPDIVMKQAREQSYFLGVASNTDWELARRSPAHVWLVNDKVDGVDRVLAAVGNNFGDPVDVTTAADYDLLRTAKLIGDTFKAAVYPVNAYQIPTAPDYAAQFGGAAVPPVKHEQALRRQTERQHSAAVKALAKFFKLSRENVHICEGHPNKVIPELADTVKADLIVLGAKSIGRLERLLGSVTVEPVMAETDCDILIIRDRDLASVPNVATTPLHGVPRYDLEQAIVDPEGTFESPLEIANVPEISIDLRRRILEAWEYDIRAEMEVESEGGAVRDIDVNALDAIHSAKALLDMKQEKADNGTLRLSAASA